MLKEVVCPIFEVLFEDDVPHMYYQQDGAPAHYLRGVRDWLNETFGTKWIGRGGPLELPARRHQWTLALGGSQGKGLCTQPKDC